MKTRFILTGMAMLITALLIVMGCNGSNKYIIDNNETNETNETLLGADKNNYNWGKPKKLSRPKVANTFNLNFAVFGDPQPDLNMYYPYTYSDEWCSVPYESKGCNWPDKGRKITRMGTIVDQINKHCNDDDCPGVVAVGDLTQHSCTQELIAFRQNFEHDYPGHHGGSIASASDSWYDRYRLGDSKIKKPVYPTLGNHGDPSRTICGEGCSCHDMNNNSKYSTYVKDYIRERMEGSAAIYEKPTLLQTKQGSYREGHSGDLYAWEWGSYHFIQMGIWAGYNTHAHPFTTLTSKLDWLKDYLENIIGDSGKPVILFQHYGWSEWNFDDNWWHQHNADDLINVLCRRENTDDTCNPYNIVAIFSGHTHKFQHRIIHVGLDKNDENVTFINYIVNDSGPADNGDQTGFFKVFLSADEDGNGAINVTKHMIDYASPDDASKWTHSTSDYATRTFPLAFMDWEQGEPNNLHGTQSCAVFNTKGRLNDHLCTEQHEAICIDKESQEMFITKKLHDWYGAQKACQSYSGADFMTLDSLVKQRDLMNLLESKTSFYWVNNRSPWILKTSIDKHIGTWNQGAGMAMGDIDGNDRPDLIAAYIDNPDGGNHLYYRIGLNINEEGVVAEWSASYDAMGGDEIGSHSQGGGVTMGDINHDANITSDILFYYIDNPEGQNHGHYRIQFDVENNGTGGTLGERQDIPVGLFGSESQGGGVALGDINKNGTLDLIVYNIDNPDGENTARYIIGYDLNASGVASYWSTVYHVNEHIGSENEGGGLAVADIDENGILDLIMYYIDNPDGENHPYYYIGWNLGEKGNVSHWSNKKMGPFTLGSDNQGGGIAVGNIDSNRRPDFIPAEINNPDGENTFHYGVGMNIDREGNFDTLHLDKDGKLSSEK